jgi:hypothetical protein
MEEKEEMKEKNFSITTCPEHRVTEGFSLSHLRTTWLPEHFSSITSFH